jgi:general secretion pathway protein C
VSAFVIWAMLAASAMFWALRLSVTAPAAPAYTVPVGDTAMLRGDLTRLFGSAATAPTAAAPVPQAASRYRLVGVVAPLPNAPQGNGIAAISIDGKPARPFRVGSKVEGDLQLRSVTRRGADLGPADGSTGFTLELPPRQAAATGTLPAVSLKGDAADDEPAPVPTQADVPPPPQQVQPQPPQVQPPQLQPSPRPAFGNPANR